MKAACANSGLVIYAKSFQPLPCPPRSNGGSTASPRIAWAASWAFSLPTFVWFAEFERATLCHAFEAVTASAIMVAAQFGLPEGLGQRSELQAFFHVSAFPAWPPSEVYIYPYGEQPGIGCRCRSASRPGPPDTPEPGAPSQIGRAADMTLEQIGVLS